jgi:hypothetical protein
LILLFIAFAFFCRNALPKYPILATGGIDSADVAFQFLCAGAPVMQVKLDCFETKIVFSLFLKRLNVSEIHRSVLSKITWSTNYKDDQKFVIILNKVSFGVLTPPLRKTVATQPNNKFIMKFQNNL